MRNSRDIAYGVPFCSVTSARPAAFRAAVNSALGISRMMAASRLTGAITRRFVSSQAMPPQCSPPMLPGTIRLPFRLGGVNMPS